MERGRVVGVFISLSPRVNVSSEGKRRNDTLHYQTAGFSSSRPGARNKNPRPSRNRVDFEEKVFLVSFS